MAEWIKISEKSIVNLTERTEIMNVPGGCLIKVTIRRPEGAPSVAMQYVPGILFEEEGFRTYSIEETMGQLGEFGKSFEGLQSALSSLSNLNKRR